MAGLWVCPLFLALACPTTARPIRGEETGGPVLIAKLTAAPGADAELERILRELVAHVVASEPDCIEYRVHRSIENPLVFVVYERYRNQAALEAHNNAAYLLSAGERLMKLLSQPPEVETCSAL